NQVRRLLTLSSDLVHHRREIVERRARLGLRRLDHDRLFDDQGKVDRRRMKPKVEEALGNVQRAYAGACLLAATREHELVHTASVVGDVVYIGQERTKVVGIQHGGLAERAQTLFAVHTDIGEAASQD